jgi:hypothetical protein
MSDKHEGYKLVVDNEQIQKSLPHKREGNKSFIELLKMLGLYDEKEFDIVMARVEKEYQSESLKEKDR